MDLQCRSWPHRSLDGPCIYYVRSRGKGRRADHCGVMMQWLWGYDPMVVG